MSIKVVVFDAYGTLFDVSAAARELALESENKQFKNCWIKLATDWRLKQLQYTWLRAIMKDHKDFWSVTEDGLDWAMEQNGLSFDTELRGLLLRLYWNLSPYPEVKEMLQDLKGDGFLTAILSNGSPQMLGAAVGSADISTVLDAVLSVEDVGVFKPDPLVYELIEKRFCCKRLEVLFVSSNGWDISAGAGFGFKTVWVNRSGEPVDRLSEKPLKMLETLVSIPKLAASSELASF